MTDLKYMKAAFLQAQKSALADEVPVGAVLVDLADGKILARAHNTSEHGNDPTAHAEISLIRKASRRLKTKRLWNTALYVTLEPCAMCAAAISFARVSKLVFAASDPKGGAVINGVRFFESASCHHKPEIVSGVYEQPCSEILKIFFRQKRNLKNHDLQS